jgi:isoleucyl-tRNA synthetase
VAGVAVVVEKAEARGLVKCARSWRFTADVGTDEEFPDVSARDAAALAELRAAGRF